MGKGDLIKKIIELNQIKDLNSVQKEAIKKGVLEGKNLVISSPTSSGKTLVAEIAGLNVFLTQKRKMVYLCPLVALAREKYNDFKKKYEKLGIKVALSIGDYDSSDPWLQNYNWIIASLDYDQPILIKISGEVKNLPIGELWDFFSKKKIEKDNKEGYEILDISSFNVKGVVFDPKDYKLKFKKVEKIIRHRVSDPLFEITLQTGRKIKVTLSHSLFVLENLKIKSKPTTEIKEGDYILIPKNLPHSQGTKKNFDLLSEFIKLGIFKNIYVKNLPLRLFKLRKLKKLPLPSYCLKNWKKRKHLPLKVINELKLMKFIPDTAVFGYVGCRSDVPIKIKITPELMRILGYYLAEGSLDLGRYKISFVFNLREKRYVEDLYQCFLKVFNFRPVLTFKKNVIYLEASNKISYSVFERILKVSKGAKNKEIPTLVFNTDKYLKLHFLKAAFRGDGNLNPTAFNYTTSSQKLTSDLLYLLLQMGVVGSVYERKKEQISYIKGRKIRTSGNFQIFINAKKSKEKLKELLRDVPENLVARGFTQPRIEMIPSEQIIPIFEEFWGSRKIKKFIHFGKRLSLYRFRKWALAPGRKIKIEILKFLNSKGKLKCSEIVSFLNKSWGDVNEKLKFLLESELIEREGNLGHYFYSISKKGKELLKNINQIENLFFSDFAFAKVKGIKKIKSKNNYVFDVSVPGYENFVGGIGGVICHNSNEKMDSLIRHGAPWINQIGLIVADEIHLLNDFSRGPTLEILLTLLRELVPQSQILALSATVKNGEELAKWLNAYPLKSDFRPVPLYQGIFLGNKIKVFSKKVYLLKRSLPPEEGITEDTLLMKKQLIFFLSTRRNTEALAERLAKIVPAYLDFKEKIELERLSQKIGGTLEIPTSQCKKLAECIRGGVAFYHAGLVSQQKILIEEAYKKGVLKTVTSTTALAFGINLPNFRAVVRDVKRFYPGLGSTYIPVLEVQQMFGRSGRPQFDRWGEGILIAKTKEEERELERIYLRGELEEISSKISTEIALRMHILALIANRFCQSREKLMDFFSKTFFGFKFGSSYLGDKIEKILALLENWNFIKRETLMIDDQSEEKFQTTKLGKRIAELYIDPLTAHQFIEGLRFSLRIKNFPLLHLISRAAELKPSLTLRARDLPEVERIISNYEDDFLIELPDQFDEEYEEFMKEVKLALVFALWMEEETDQKILEKFGVSPGELRSRLEIADWLLYSLLEIGKIILISKLKMRKMREVRKRLYYGIKEELLNLIRLEGIGRVRARLLFNAGIQTISKLKKTPLKEISKVLKSKKLAQKIKNQISTAGFKRGFR